MVRRLLVPATVAVLVALAATPLARIYHGPLLTRLLLGASVAPVLLGVAMRRLPAWTVAPVSALCLAGYTLFAVNVSARSGGVPGHLVPLWTDAVRNGIPRVLTALIPVEPQPDTVFVPIVATWLAALAGVELAGRAGRTLAGYAPPTLLYAGVLVLVGPNARPALWQPLAYAAVAAAGLAASGPGSGLPSGALAVRLRGLAAALAALAVVVGLGVAVGPALAHRVRHAPTDPRRYVTPPNLDAQDENPLIRLSGWGLNPTEKLFDTRIATTVPADRLRIRLAVLSDYDGVNWRVDGDYREAGRVLPPVTGPGAAGVVGVAAGQPITQTITVRDLDGRLLPAAPAVREVDGVRVGYDQATGTLIEPEGLTPGLTYTVHSAQSTMDVNLLPGADVPGGPAVARYLQLGNGVPDEMTRLAQQLGGSAASPYQRAQVIEQFLADHYTYVTDAPSGHAYPNLNFFLFAARNLGGQRGGTEQFAAAFAVLARMLGLPSRVVVGFQARPGTATVTGKDALAWPEVLFSGVGWVPFDPLPKANTPPRPVEDDFQPKPSPPTAAPSVAPTVPVSATPSASHRSPGPSTAAAPVGVPVGPVAGAGGGLVGALLLVFCGLLLARRAQRRHRLDRGPPGERVAGAWREVLDGLRLAGRPAAPHLAVTEVVAYAAELAENKARPGRLRLPAPPLDDLAALANEVTFAGTAADEDDARRARAQALAYVAELRARSPWWRRLLWSLDPRPLLWYRRQTAERHSTEKE